MKDSMNPLQEFTRDEAIEFLTECVLLEQTIRILKRKAQETLSKPHLKLVEVKDDRENSR